MIPRQAGAQTAEGPGEKEEVDFPCTGDGDAAVVPQWLPLPWNEIFSVVPQDWRLHSYHSRNQFLGRLSSPISQIVDSKL